MIRPISGRTIVIGLLTIGLMLGGINQTVLAETFSQKIKAIDCTTTNINTGAQSSTSTECAGIIPPTVMPLTTDSTRPLIMGTYDPDTTAQLSVLVNGRWYRLGIDSALTTQQGYWYLNLAVSGQFLVTGAYNIIAQVVTTNNLLLQDVTIGELVIYNGIYPVGTVIEGTINAFPTRTVFWRGSAEQNVNTIAEKIIHSHDIPEMSPGVASFRIPSWAEQSRIEPFVVALATIAYIFYRVRKLVNRDSDDVTNEQQHPPHRRQTS